MKQIFKIPWGAWTSGEETHILEFPDTWNVHVYNMRDAEDITNPETIQNALNNPINTSTIFDLASGKKTAVMAVEDISRPTKCGPICEKVLEQLNTAGISDKNITLIGAIGSHRPMNREDYIKKVGANIVERINIENHHPYENLVELGKSRRGTPIYLNKTYYKADVRISIGTVVPHPLAGFGGGAKIILPGISGIKTLAANHKAALQGQGIGIGFITDLRKDIEEVCERVGLDFSINIIATKNRGIAGIFAGHFIDAHRKAIELAKKVYHTDLPKLKEEEKFDIGLYNLFPEDTELTQSSKGINSFLQTEQLLKEEASIIFLTASTEGRGYHSLFSETGSRLYDDWKEAAEVLQEFCEEKSFAIYSPNLSKADVKHFWPDKTLFYNNFYNMIEKLEKQVSKSPKAAIFPTSIQLFS
jgi:nickel-dependent lactate racemase